MPFKITLTNDHIINAQKNVLAGVVKKGPTNVVFDFSYNNRKNEVFVDLGFFILEIIPHIPNGVLVIFSSYSILSACKHVWTVDDRKILDCIGLEKEVIFEPKNTMEMDEAMKRYCRIASTKKGAILFAVCRGKIRYFIYFFFIYLFKLN